MQAVSTNRQPSPNELHEKLRDASVTFEAKLVLLQQLAFHSIPGSHTESMLHVEAAIWDPQIEPEVAVAAMKLFVRNISNRIEMLKLYIGGRSGSRQLNDQVRRQAVVCLGDEPLTQDEQSFLRALLNDANSSEGIKNAAAVVLARMWRDEAARGYLMRALARLAHDGSGSGSNTSPQELVGGLDHFKGHEIDDFLLDLLPQVNGSPLSQTIRETLLRRGNEEAFRGNGRK